MINIRNLEKVFHAGTVNENKALGPLDLKINAGDFITIIGSNGAGKSTLFNLIAGTYLPSAGTIKVNNKDITTLPEYRRAHWIGRIFQDPTRGTAASMTLEDNMIIADHKGFKGLRVSLNKTKREKFREILKPLGMGLEDRLKDNVGLLSGGQRQALTLLMVVMSHPELIMLDEHTAALDPHNAEIIQKLTLDYIARDNLTTMMITHNMNHAIELGNRLIMMDGGEIVLDVCGEEKQRLTPVLLVEKFREIRHKDFTNDQVLLTEE